MGLAVVPGAVLWSRSVLRWLMMMAACASGQALRWWQWPSWVPGHVCVRSRGLVWQDGAARGRFGCGTRAQAT